MPVIHGIWARGALGLWGEDPARPAAPPAGRDAPGPHPFACLAADLAGLLAALPGPAGQAARRATAAELTLQLPTAAGAPLASPQLVRPGAVDPARVPRAGLALAGWRVPVLILPPAAALDLLRAAGQVGELAVPGPSVPYLAALAAFADRLAARGRILPVLAAEDDGYAARWRPVLSGTDEQRARELAAAMPASCRAAGAADPASVLAAVLNGLTDAAVRSRLPDSLLPARRGRAPARAPAADRFVAALAGPEALLDAAVPADEAAELASELAAWLAAARIPGGPVRTCFRLAEPDATTEGGADSGPWRVEFTLQSADDPSLMLPAAEVWAGQGLGVGGDPVEELLAGLGTAARLFGELEDALREPAPVMVELDTPGAFRFLKETGPLLSGAGFGVLLPDWVRRARLGLKLTTRSRTPSGGSPARARFGLGDLVDFRYDVAVGDQALDPAELAELARRKVPLVRLRGQWVELDEAHLRAALKFLARPPARHDDGRGRAVSRSRRGRPRRPAGGRGRGRLAG